MAIVWTSRAVHANVCAVRAVFQAFNIVYCMSFSNIENTPLLLNVLYVRQINRPFSEALKGAVSCAKGQFEPTV